MSLTALTSVNGSIQVGHTLQVLAEVLRDSPAQAVMLITTDAVLHDVLSLFLHGFVVLPYPLIVLASAPVPRPPLVACVSFGEGDSLLRPEDQIWTIVWNG